MKLWRKDLNVNNDVSITSDMSHIWMSNVSSVQVLAPLYTYLKEIIFLFIIVIFISFLLGFIYVNYVVTYLFLRQCRSSIERIATTTSVQVLPMKVVPYRQKQNSPSSTCP